MHTKQDRRKGDKRTAERRRVNIEPILFERRKDGDRRKLDRRKSYQLQSILPEYNIPIDKNYLYNRIEIRDPYFALEDIKFINPLTVSAKVPIEQPLMMEAPPITGAEAGRHLAILGACGISMNNKLDKHYYLAYSAELERSVFDPTVNYSKYLYGISRVRPISERISESVSELKTEERGELIYKLQTRYIVISQKVFARRFQKMQRDMRQSTRQSSESCNSSIDRFIKMRGNPFTRPLFIHNRQISHNKLKATLGVITPEICCGHFPLFPALPKAILMNTLSNAAGELLKLRFNRSIQYYVKKSSIRSDNLAFAGELVNIEVSCENINLNDYLFYCQSYTPQKKIGDMWLTLTLID